MKKIKLIIFTLAVLLLAIPSVSNTAKAEPLGVSVSFQLFYDELSPYGSWVSYPSYGYVWVPATAVSFRPYTTGGHWVFTDAGWMWVSDYPWGWAPFHYGTWNFDPFYGWMWVPGYAWAPAWVEWGYYGDYYGWAPLGPGFSLSVSYYRPIEYWSFAQPRYLVSGDFSNHYVVASNQRINLEGNGVITDARA